MLKLVGFLIVYFVIGLIVVPKVDPTKPKVDIVAFIKGSTYAFSWPIIAYNAWKAKKAAAKAAKAAGGG